MDLLRNSKVLIWCIGRSGGGTPPSLPKNTEQIFSFLMKVVLKFNPLESSVEILMKTTRLANFLVR